MQSWDVCIRDQPDVLQASLFALTASATELVKIGKNEIIINIKITIIRENVYPELLWHKIYNASSKMRFFFPPFYCSSINFHLGDWTIQRIGNGKAAFLWQVAS